MRRLNKLFCGCLAAPKACGEDVSSASQKLGKPEGVHPAKQLEDGDAVNGLAEHVISPSNSVIDFNKRRGILGNPDYSYSTRADVHRRRTSSRALVGGVEYSSFFVNPLAEGCHEGGVPIAYAGASIAKACDGLTNPLAEEFVGYATTPPGSPARLRKSLTLTSPGGGDSDSHFGAPSTPGTPSRLGNNFAAHQPAGEVEAAKADAALLPLLGSRDLLHSPMGALRPQRSAASCGGAPGRLLIRSMQSGECFSAAGGGGSAVSGISVPVREMPQPSTPSLRLAELRAAFTEASAGKEPSASLAPGTLLPMDEEKQLQHDDEEEEEEELQQQRQYQQLKMDQQEQQQQHKEVLLSTGQSGAVERDSGGQEASTLDTATAEPSAPCTPPLAVREVGALGSPEPAKRRDAAGNGEGAVATCGIMASAFISAEQGSIRRQLEEALRESQLLSGVPHAVVALGRQQQEQGKEDKGARQQQQGKEGQQQPQRQGDEEEEGQEKAPTHQQLLQEEEAQQQLQPWEEEKDGSQDKAQQRQPQKAGWYGHVGQKLHTYDDEEEEEERSKWAQKQPQEEEAGEDLLHTVPDTACDGDCVPQAPELQPADDAASPLPELQPAEDAASPLPEATVPSWELGATVRREDIPAAAAGVAAAEAGEQSAVTAFVRPGERAIELAKAAYVGSLGGALVHTKSLGFAAELQRVRAPLSTPGAPDDNGAHDPGCSISGLAMTRAVIRQLGLLPVPGSRPDSSCFCTHAVPEPEPEQSLARATAAVATTVVDAAPAVETQPTVTRLPLPPLGSNPKQATESERGPSLPPSPFVAAHHTAQSALVADEGRDNMAVVVVTTKGTGCTVCVDTVDMGDAVGKAQRSLQLREPGYDGQAIVRAHGQHVIDASSRLSSGDWCKPDGRNSDKIGAGAVKAQAGTSGLDGEAQEAVDGNAERSVEEGAEVGRSYGRGDAGRYSLLTTTSSTSSIGDGQGHGQAIVMSTLSLQTYAEPQRWTPLRVRYGGVQAAA